MATTSSGSGGRKTPYRAKRTPVPLGLENFVRHKSDAAGRILVAHAHQRGLGIVEPRQFIGASAATTHMLLNRAAIARGGFFTKLIGFQIKGRARIHDGYSFNLLATHRAGPTYL